MRKSLKALLFSFTCLCFVGAMGCKGDDLEISSVDSLPPVTSEDSVGDSSSNPDAPKPEGTLAVTFVKGEGYTFESNIPDGYLAYEGETLSFRIKQSVFYDGSPVVKVNGESQSHQDGLYSVTITEASEITVEGIYKATSALATGEAGTGAFDDAFVVSRPIDLLYIAEQVNKGVYEYVTGAYVLANDIDCGGEELQVIGDMSTDNSYFSGCFTCYTNPDTNEMVPATISNFVINSENANYVGLFGTVYNDLSITSSGLFYGINLANFTVNARLDENMMSSNRSISVGGLIGYGVGANVYVCSAVDGEINVYGDDSYFCFAGGLIGYQQAFYMADTDMHFASEVVYSHADVDIRILKGLCLYAGGISGYMATNNPSGSTAFIHNSYANGNISGALRAGGIVGGLGQYTSVGNCYATGDIFAKASQSLDDILLTDTQYCYANAGGIVGYADNDTIVNDCFFVGKTTASSESAGCAFTGDIISGGQEKATASAAAEKYLVQNCLTADQFSDSKEENTSLIKDTFAWTDAEWVFSDETSIYPVINYASVSGQIINEITFVYVVNGQTDVAKIDGKSSISQKYFDTNLQSANIYAPMGNYFLTETFDRMLIDDNGLLSYGYFFDQACTQKVPYSYVPQRNVTLYVGFSDPQALVGTYQLTNGNTTKPLTVTFDEEGYATYSDGFTKQTSYYFFDGTNVIIEGARLARYYDGAIIIDETDTTVVADANFDLYRYNYYDFVGVLSENGLTLYDGIYFTADNPLMAYTELFRGEYFTADDTVYKFYGEKATAEKGASYIEYTYAKAGNNITLTNASGTTTINVDDLLPFDAFKGSWTKSATINKTYTFDGKGHWSYEYVSYQRISNGYTYTYEEQLIDQASGTYIVDKNGLELTLDNGAVVTFNDDGNLTVTQSGKTQVFYGEYSYVGVWKSNNMTVALHGITNEGFGKATLDYGDGMSYELVYEPSETAGYVCLYWPHDVYTKDALFGYFTYDRATNTLYATVSDANNVETGYAQGNLFVVDDYIGDWICDAEEFANVEFSFNGNGLYGFLYGYEGMEGQLTLRDLTDGTRTTVTYTLDSTLKGRFPYKGSVWVMQYDEDLQAIILTVDGKDDAQLQRKDELANLKFVDLNGTTYHFDGRSQLSNGGTMTVDSTTKYTYISNENGWIVKNGDAQVGTLVLSENEKYYELTLNDTLKHIYLHNEFMGNWAIGGQFGMFTIGPSDLSGAIQANYKGYPVELTTIEPNLLTFKYREDNMPLTYYVFVVPDNVLGYDVLVLSQYTNLYSGDYAICTKAHELYGEWVGKSFTLTFDGIESGAYSYGLATLSRGNGNTNYSYRTSEHGTIMWSQSVLGGEVWYYDIVMLDITKANLNASDVFVKTDKDGNVIAAIQRIRRNTVDDLLFAAAKDKGGNTYFFYGNNVDDKNGDLYVNGVLSHTYDIVSNDSKEKIFTLEITETATGKTYSATLNYATSGDFVLTIGAEITSE